MFEICYAQDFEVEFMLLGNDNNVTYDLKIVFPEGLYEYYSNKSHRLTTISEFSGFVTPYVFESVADKLWEVYNNNEDFVNSLLSIVHQMDYEETVPIKYSVETIVDGKGDCDLFSIVVASVAKAGGLDVVLLYYEEQTHMNVGIHLSRAPQDARDEVRYVTYDNKQYYVAECTGENWMEGWRVGECPPDLKDVSVEVISLEGTEQVAPGQASASFTSLDSSVLSLDITPAISLQNTNLNVIGQLSPAIENQNVTLYASVNNSPWIVLGTVTTVSNGYFQYLWESEFSGIISVLASWSGNNQFAGAVSATKNATVIPSIVVNLLLMVTIVGIAGVILILIMKRTQNEEVQPEYW
ncbi:MAG: hypothetical protein NWF10_02220 [Candidatus Bathyarchaeota archaeon]|nr:hypothetical protein [Candidatus Bathyarchaeota archaeon]